MTFKLYTKISLVLLVTLIIIIVTANYLWNPYGLFGNVKGQEIKIIDYEKSSKYLMSFNYIPQNFEGLLVGPSLSANLDTKKITNYKIYNLSMNGGNISELKMAVDNVIKYGNLKFIIFCLDPYITKDYGMKSSQINPKEYIGSLGSLNSVKIFIRTIIGEKRQFRNSEFGFNNSSLNNKTDSKKNILEKIESIKNEEYKFYGLDINALKDFETLIKYAESKNIQLFAYKYPRHYDLYQLLMNKYEQVYSRQINLFNKNLILFDFFDQKFDVFRKDYNSYSDGSHLSYSGADVVLKEIENQLNIFYKRNL